MSLLKKVKHKVIRARAQHRIKQQQKEARRAQCDQMRLNRDFSRAQREEEKAIRMEKRHEADARIQAARDRQKVINAHKREKRLKPLVAVGKGVGKGLGDLGASLYKELSKKKK